MNLSPVYKNKNFWFVILVLIVSLIGRFIILQFRYAIGFDEPHYLQLAASLINGKFTDVFHPYWPPMYPLMIAVGSYLVKDIELTARLVSMIFGSFVVVPVYFLAKEIFNEKIAYISIVLLAVFPQFMYSDTSALSEGVYKWLTVWGIFFSWNAIKDRNFIWALIAGLFFGGAYLTRPEGIGTLIVFIGFAGIVLVYAFLKNRELKLLTIIGSTIVGFFIISLPYMIYLKGQVGEWTLSAKWYVNQQTLAAGNTSKEDIKNGIGLLRLQNNNTILPADMAWHSGDFFKLTQKKRETIKSDHKISNDLKFALTKLVKNNFLILDETLTAIFTLGLLICFILGLFGDGWRKDNIVLILYLFSFIAFFWFLVVPFFHINTRYFMALLPLCFIWIGKGLNNLVCWANSVFRFLLNKTNDAITVKLGITFGILFVFFLSYFPQIVRVAANLKKSNNYWGEAFELKKAGKWLKENSDKPPVLMDYNKSVDFYAGQYDIRKGVSIPDHNYEDILEYARNRNVDYIVLSSRYNGRNKFKTDSLDFLLDCKQLPPSLEIVYSDEINETGIEIITKIFKVLPNSN